MPPKRRSYIKTVKAQIIQEYAQSDASTAGVALHHGLNANLVHKWIRAHSQKNWRCKIIHPAERAGHDAAAEQQPSHDPYRNHPRTRHGCSELARRQRRRVRDVSTRSTAIIRVDSICLVSGPMDMRVGTETALTPCGSGL
ncbi:MULTISPECIES: transposase [unclassified Pseudomonas]|jgi:transposase-like protein|uniref:transposase n=1 Tax=unclassified Pseudomonas TaxID=196821 RepID=UPI000DAD9499|nr:transposase [Pseudomonas sp. URMO17WK12:I6]